MVHSYVQVHAAHDELLRLLECRGHCQRLVLDGGVPREYLDFAPDQWRLQLSAVNAGSYSREGLFSVMLIL